MEQYYYEKTMDEILRFIQSSEYYRKYKDIERKFKNVDGKVFFSMFDKLLDDGYIKDYMLNLPKYDMLSHYMITAEGSIFLNKGGYYGESINILSEKSSRKRNDNLLVFGSLGAAFGAAGLLFVEFLKSLNKDYDFVCGVITGVFLILCLTIASLIVLLLIKQWRKSE